MYPALMVNGQKLIPVRDRDARPAWGLLVGDETWHVASVPGGGYRLQRSTDHWARMFPSLEGAVAYVTTLERTGQHRGMRHQGNRADDGDTWNA
jgi:hypothetical protein